MTQHRQVTVTLDPEEAKAAKWILGRSPQVEMPTGPLTAAQRAWDKLRAALQEGDGPEHGKSIPRDYWRGIPCGHPPDPVAMFGADGESVCHCGRILDQQYGVEIEGAPGPVVPCYECGCAVSIPPHPHEPETPQENDGKSVGDLLRGVESAVQALEAKRANFCVNREEASDECDCLLCRTSTLIAGWEDDTRWNTPIGVTFLPDEPETPQVSSAQAEYDSLETVDPETDPRFQPQVSSGDGLAGVVKRLERIRDLDEELSDGSLGSLARYALDEIAALPPSALTDEERERLIAVADLLDGTATPLDDESQRERNEHADFLRTLAGKEQRCERCEGAQWVYEVIASTPNGDEYGPCPDCHPSYKEGQR